MTTDWEKHFRQRRPKSNTDFGMVGGQHTVAELKDLLAAQMYSVNQTQKAINDNTPSLALHPDDYVLLLNDWNVLLARWNQAAAAAQKVIDAWHPFDTLAIAENEYVGILKALQITYPQLYTSPGDLIDIVQRLKKLNVTPDYSQMPQPTAGSDADFQVLQTTNAIVDAATPSKKTWIYAAIGAGLAGLFLPRILRAFLPI